MISVLQRLVSRYLSNDEIILASFRKNSPKRTDLLNVTRSSGMEPIALSVGENPHFTVTVESF